MSGCSGSPTGCNGTCGPLRRRADEAIRLVDAAARLRGQGKPGDYEDWHLARLRALLLLDRAESLAIEERTLVADRDDLAEICIATSIPAPRGTCAQRAQLRN